MDKLEQVLHELQDVKVTQAVQNETLKHIRDKLDNGESQFDKQEKKIKKLEERVDRQDKIYGGIAIAVSIVFTLIKLKIL